MKSNQIVQFVFKTIEFRKKYFPSFEEKINKTLIDYTKDFYNNNFLEHNYEFDNVVTSQKRLEQMNLENLSVINVLKNNLCLDNNLKNLNYETILNRFSTIRNYKINQQISIFNKLLVASSITESIEIVDLLNENYLLICMYLKNDNYLRAERTFQNLKKEENRLLTISNYKESLIQDDKFEVILLNNNNLQNCNNLKGKPKSILLIEYLLIKTKKIDDYLLGKAKQIERGAKFKELYNNTYESVIKTKTKNFKTKNDFENLIKNKEVLEIAILFVYQNLENEKENINKEFLEYLLKQYNVE